MGSSRSGGGLFHRCLSPRELRDTTGVGVFNPAHPLQKNVTYRVAWHLSVDQNLSQMPNRLASSLVSEIIETRPA
jgi:hypothetical protein